MYVESREKKVEGSAWMARVGAPARRLSREKGSRENAQDTCLCHEIREYIVGEIY